MVTRKATRKIELKLSASVAPAPAKISEEAAAMTNVVLAFGVLVQVRSSTSIFSMS